MLTHKQIVNLPRRLQTTSGFEAMGYTQDGGVTVAVKDLATGKVAIVRVRPSVCRAAARTTRKKREVVR